MGYRGLFLKRIQEVKSTEKTEPKRSGMQGCKTHVSKGLNGWLHRIAMQHRELPKNAPERALGKARFRDRSSTNRSGPFQ